MKLQNKALFPKWVIYMLVVFNLLLCIAFFNVQNVKTHLNELLVKEKYSFESKIKNLKNQLKVSYSVKMDLSVLDTINTKHTLFLYLDQAACSNCNKKSLELLASISKNKDGIKSRIIMNYLDKRDAKLLIKQFGDYPTTIFITKSISNLKFPIFFTVDTLSSPSNIFIEEKYGFSFDEYYKCIRNKKIWDE